MFVATKFYISTGYGIDKYAIASFDKALLMAGMGNYNLVKVSSIIPPNSKQTDHIYYPTGSVVFTAYSSTSTESSELISSAVAAAIPKDNAHTGVIMEFSCKGDREKAINMVKALAIDALHRRDIYEYDLFADGIQTQGVEGMITTTFAAIALL